MLRELYPADVTAMVRHLLSLSPEDRALRFGAAKSDEAIAWHCAVLDWARARFLGVFAGKDLVGLVELAAPDLARADWREAAISVAPSARRRGVGRRLLAAAADLARRLGCTRLVFYWQPGNRGFSSFLAACSGVIQIHPPQGWLDLAGARRHPDAGRGRTAADMRPRGAFRRIAACG